MRASVLLILPLLARGRTRGHVDQDSPPNHNGQDEPEYGAANQKLLHPQQMLLLFEIN
jgi:hypothetical protein